MWLCWHHWNLVRVFHYVDSSYGGRAPSSALWLQCSKCGDVKVKHFSGAGHIELTELNDSLAHRSEK